jgi:hypothetical protein
VNEKQKKCSHIFLPTGKGRCHKCDATRAEVQAWQRELVQEAQRRAPGYDDGGTAQMRCPWCDGTVTWNKRLERTVVAVPYTEGADVYVPQQKQIRWSDMAHSEPRCERFKEHAELMKVD